MANTGFSGIDVRQTSTAIVYRALLQNSSGALVTTGTTSLYLYEVQSDGTLKSYDFASSTFKTTALTTETTAMTHQSGNAGSTPTGVWTVAQVTLSGLTKGGIYLARVNNANASPTDQVREFQFGGAQGDLTVTGTNLGAVVNAYASGQDPATYCLVTPSQKIATNASNQVVASSVQGNVTGSVGSIAGVSFPANFGSLAVDSSGRVVLQPSGLDAVVIETSVNARQGIALILASAAGTLSGAATTSIAIGNASGTARVAGTVDANGNRSAITWTPPA